MSNIQLEGLQGCGRLGVELTATVRDRENEDVGWLDDHSQIFGPSALGTRAGGPSDFQNDQKSTTFLYSHSGVLAGRSRGSDRHNSNHGVRKPFRARGI